MNGFNSLTLSKNLINNSSFLSSTFGKIIFDSIKPDFIWETNLSVIIMVFFSFLIEILLSIWANSIMPKISSILSHCLKTLLILKKSSFESFIL